MRWITLGLALFRSREDIEKLYTLLKPLINEALKVGPEAIPIAKRIMKALEVGNAEETPIDVFWLQRFLNTHYAAGLVVDGDYGEKTKEAVKKYQQQLGLDVDGWAGIDTTTTMYNDWKRTNLIG